MTLKLEADDIENAQQQFKINTKDTQRADKKNKTKGKGEQVKKRNDEHVTKKQKKLFHDKVKGVHMDLLQCDSSMISFNFKMLDVKIICTFLAIYTVREWMLTSGATSIKNKQEGLKNCDT